MDKSKFVVAAVVTAAGASLRMGVPKMLLPWGGKTVIETVVGTLISAGVTPVVVVTGGESDQVENLLADYPVDLVRNPDFLQTEMLKSIQLGVGRLRTVTQLAGILFALGDHPQMKRSNVEMIVTRFTESRRRIVIPSFNMRRGHPWLMSADLITELMDLEPTQSLRDLVNQHASEIDYVEAEDDSILQDLDTPEDYKRFRPALK